MVLTQSSGKEADVTADPVRDPTYWLVYALPWPDSDGEYRESAVAFAPAITPRTNAPRDVRNLLDLADAYQHETGWRVMFFSDLTLWLDSVGHSWSALNLDWEGAFEHIIERTSPPMLYLYLNHFAHVIVCDASRRGVTLFNPDGTTEQVPKEERMRVRAALDQMITRDWPGFIDELRSSGRLRQAN